MDGPSPMDGKYLDKSKLPSQGARGKRPMSCTASSTHGMRNRHSGRLSFTCDFVRSETDRTGYGVPSRRKARRSEGRTTMWRAEQTAPSGSSHTPSENASMASSLDMYLSVASHSFQHVAPLGMVVEAGVGDSGGLTPMRISEIISRW